MRSLLLISCLACASTLWAEPKEEAAPNRVLIAEVTSIQGIAHLIQPDSVRRISVQPDTKLYAGDSVITLSSTRLILKIIDGSKAIIESGARIRFRSPDEFHHERGVAYFDIAERAQLNRKPLQIRTDFAVAGVRGTEFIINADIYSPAIALNEGGLDIVSTDQEPFEVISRKEMTFDDFKRQRQSDFAEYRHQLMEEFIEYKNQFILQPGKMIRFNGKRVTEEAFDKDSERMFELFRGMLP